MKKIQQVMVETKNKIAAGLKNEQGNLQELSWQAGAVALTVVLFVALIAFFPDKVTETLENLFDWVANELGF
ncbi:MAG: hypothetical protein ACOY35_01390 [Bacillota bacterium]